MVDLKSHEDWVVMDLKLNTVASGNGIPGLKAALDDKECSFVAFRIYAKNVGNTGAEITTEANMILHWKGSKAPGTLKVKSNGVLEAAQKKVKGCKGFIEVTTKGSMLTTDNIFDRWRPGSGSKMIEDEGV
eukprot:TRINITY_DN308_c0_g1_i4.p1 TRINITY_DN308_c0_g1~~TRINITY_DN308_c0_g1_i4.p1  ORF type:complete len:131 (+),score=18.87 TRINITY_DN308_c0_g1_i4:45-437(+)